MSRQLSELESILHQMIAEHQRLVTHVEKHESGMKAFDLKVMDDAARLQESSRLRIAAMEQRRRALTSQIARSLSLPGDLTIRKLAELNPARAISLLKLRAELKEAVEQVTARTHVTGRLAHAVLGHLNAVVRLIAGAVEKAGIYTRQGIPQVSSRIGVMEAVG